MHVGGEEAVCRDAEDIRGVALHNPSLLHHHHPVIVYDGVDAMRNGEDGASRKVLP